MRFETDGFERPTRSATSPSASPNSSSSTAYARASSTGVQLLACDVLDQSEHERVAVVGLADDGGNRGVPGVARGAPAALAGDELVAARCARAARAAAG